MVEGRWAVEALLDSDLDVVEVSIESGRHEALREQCVSSGFRIREPDRETLSRQRGYPFHRGVFARVRRPELGPPGEVFLRDASRLVFPVGLADPGNLGTVIRSATAFGADGVLLPAGKGADVFNAKCIRASATAVFRIPLFEVDSPEATVERCRDAGLVCFGTSLQSGADSLREVKGSARSLVLLGSEEEGLDSRMESLCDECVRIPMEAGIDSLNVGATAAIVLYELWGRD